MATATSIYIDDAAGVDETSTAGTESAPFKTLPYAYIQHPPVEGQTVNFFVKKPADEPPAETPLSDQQSAWKPAAKAALKKAHANYEGYKKKQVKQQELAMRAAKVEKEREAVFEEAKKIVIKEDTSLPKAVKIKLDETNPEVVKLRSTAEQAKDSPDSNGTRVRVSGRVHRERKQKDMLFVTLRDGYGQMQCILQGQLAKSYDAITLTRETAMEIFGEMWEVPAGAHAPNNRELHADYYRIIGKAVGGDDAITNKVQAGADPASLLDNRHLTLRGDAASSVLVVRDAVEFAFHQTYKEVRCRKVAPPALVQTQVEGGSTLFEFKYYDESAYLTQSSQLYLETCLPWMGDVYCIEKSFRAEKSLTRRHLSEYTHIEAELDFITFDDLLHHLESVICRVLELVVADPGVAKRIQELNPDFKLPSRPFKRMRYSDAIKWLQERGIKNEDGNDHEFGDDIAEAAERKMTDEINEVIFLTHFPVEIKAFYMQKDKDDPRVTESVDCLMPGVGEIVGGSMRMDDYDELMAAYKREGIDPKDYYWYTDQRRYGTSPHGGYGLGLERFLAWLCKQHTIRDACLYPRFMTRCKP